MAPFVLGALICYPEWMVLPALFVGVIAFLFYQIPTRRMEGWRDYRAVWNSDGLGSWCCGNLSSLSVAGGAWILGSCRERVGGGGKAGVEHRGSRRCNSGTPAHRHCSHVAPAPRHVVRWGWA